MPIKSEITEKLSKNKKILIIAVCAVLGVVLIMSEKIFNLSGKSGKDDTQNYSVSYYTENLEERVKKLCAAVKGVDDVCVLLTLDTSSEFVYAKNEDTEIGSSFDSYTGEYVIISSGDEDKTVLVNEIFPKIRGVAVVCTGGERAEVQKTLTDLLSAALGVSSNKIKVAGYG